MGLYIGCICDKVKKHIGLYYYELHYGNRNWFMKHFEEVINYMVDVHKNPNTKYSPEQMFGSQNDLSFAISRLMDANKIFTSETLDNKEMTPSLREAWFDIRDDMPEKTAQDIALCIIKNTPLSSTPEQIDSIKQLFYTAMHDFTGNAQLSNAFTQILFFSGAESNTTMGLQDWRNTTE